MLGVEAGESESIKRLTKITFLWSVFIYFYLHKRSENILHLCQSPCSHLLFSLSHIFFYSSLISYFCLYSAPSSSVVIFVSDACCLHPAQITFFPSLQTFGILHSHSLSVCLSFCLIFVCALILPTLAFFSSFLFIHFSSQRSSTQTLSSLHPSPHGSFFVTYSLCAILITQFFEINMCAQIITFNKHYYGGLAGVIILQVFMCIDTLH